MTGRQEYDRRYAAKLAETECFVAGCSKPALTLKPGPCSMHHARWYKRGPGTHPCHWCRKPVTWREDLVVDHWDDDPANNAVGNLVPSCHGCNIWRGTGARPRTSRHTVDEIGAS